MRIPARKQINSRSMMLTSVFTPIPATFLKGSRAVIGLARLYRKLMVFARINRIAPTGIRKSIPPAIVILKKSANFLISKKFKSFYHAFSFPLFHLFPDLIFLCLVSIVLIRCKDTVSYTHLRAHETPEH